MHNRLRHRVVVCRKYFLCQLEREYPELNVDESNAMALKNCLVESLLESFETPTLQQMEKPCLQVAHRLLLCYHRM